MTKFEVGKTYWTRSLCDYESIYRLTVLSRTDKTIRANVELEGTKRLKIHIMDGRIEYVKPHGTYSMSATITADREGNGP